METAQQTTEGVISSEALNALPRKYLVWLVGEQRYAIKLSDVREVIAMPPLTDLPVHHRTLKGVFNLRGKIISVADLREKLSCVKNHRSAKPFVLAVELGGLEIGTIVDDVAEVMEIHDAEIQHDIAPGTHLNARREYVAGIVLRNAPQNDTTLILDMHKLMEI
jgi:purine-binding chemotaxis protein CheW